MIISSLLLLQVPFLDGPPLRQLVDEMFAGWGLGDAGSPVRQLAYLALLAVVVLAVHFGARTIIRPALLAVVRRTSTKWDDALEQNQVFLRLIHLLPALILYFGAIAYFDPGELPRLVLERLSLTYLVLIGGWTLSSFLSAIVTIYDTSFEGARQRPILSYIQVVKIFVWVCTGVLIVATLIQQSPWALLGGLGAMTAVSMLIFKDALLGLVASIQLSTNDMVRVGDWIEMPSTGIDGEVIEIALATVKVRNWDKSISMVPTYKLISEAVKNWRGMKESGARRIKRAILIDISSVRFLDEELYERVRKLDHVEGQVERKLEESKRWEMVGGLDQKGFLGGRHLTNIGIFCAYAEEHLRAHPLIREDLTLLVRQLEPTELGLPVEVYAFSAQQQLNPFEELQAEIFDHLLAAAQEFDLHIFQQPSGADIRAAFGARRA